jgi:hypothetical protein
VREARTIPTQRDDFFAVSFQGQLDIEKLLRDSDLVLTTCKVNRHEQRLE